MIQSVANQFNAGGSFMWVILAVLAVGCAVMIERLFYLYIYCSKDNLSFAQKVFSQIKSGNVHGAKEITRKRSSPMHALFGIAVDHYAAGDSDEKIMERIEQSAIRELPRLSKRINYLSLIANVSTLLGLLGTITGLQISFSSLAHTDASQSASMLASGISQAMTTTAFGLIVAVPCMVMYTVLTNRQQELVKTIDEGVSYLISTVKESRV